MTPATFDTRRRRLGLSVDEASFHCAVPENILLCWQDGAAAVPRSAWTKLDDLEVTMADTAQQMAEVVADRAANGPVVLVRYQTQSDIDRAGWNMPLGAHAMMIAWAAQAMDAEGVATRIEWAKTNG